MSRLPYQTVRRLATRPAGITPAQERVLRVVHRYHLLAASQVQQLLYADSCLRYARQQVSTLAKAGYLQPILMPNHARTGSAPVIYTLARKGRQHLAAAGIAVPRRLRPAKTRQYDYLHLTHAKEANQLLILGERLVRVTDRVQLVAVRCEHDLRRQPARVRLPDGSSTSVTPDGWLNLIERGGDGRRYATALAFEHDRGSEHVTAWRRKVRALLAWAQGPYHDLFGTTAVTIVVVAGTGEARRQQLITWTEIELQAAGMTAAADLFRFVAGHPDHLTPQTLFLAPIAYRPLDPSPRPLLEVAGEVA